MWSKLTRFPFQFPFVFLYLSIFQVRFFFLLYTDALPSSGPSSSKLLRDTTPRTSSSGSSVDLKPQSNASAPLPALSDILCGVESETSTAPEAPSLWTPTRDFVSPYVKRKFGRAGQSSSTAKRSSDGAGALPKSKDTFDRIMPSKTPAQVCCSRLIAESWRTRFHGVWIRFQPFFFFRLHAREPLRNSKRPNRKPSWIRRNRLETIFEHFAWEKAQGI